MPPASIPRLTSARPVRTRPAKQNSTLTALLCLLLAVYIGFIAFSLVTQETEVEHQTAVAALSADSADDQISLTTDDVITTDQQTDTTAPQN